MTGNETKADGSKKTEGEKRMSSDKKIDGEKKVESVQMLTEEKLTQLEKRFAELEAKVVALKEKTVAKDSDSPEQTDNTKLADSTDAAKEGEAREEADDSTHVGARVLVVISKYDKEGDLVECDEKGLPVSREQYEKKYAAVLFKKTESSYHSAAIEVLDPELRQLLRKTLKHYPGHFFIGEQVEILAPYEPFLLNWDLLEKVATEDTIEEKEKKARSDLRELLGKIKDGSGDAKLDSYLKVRDDLIKQKTITFAALWTIFAPGTIIYSNIFMKHDQLFIVEDNLRPWPEEAEVGNRRSGGTPSWKLKCWTYDFTGQIFMRQCMTLQIEQFDGPKPITSLAFYPLSLMDSDKREQIQTRLLERGKKFWQYCMNPGNHRMYEYSGEAVFDQQGFRTSQSTDDRDSGDEGSSRWYRTRSMYAQVRKSQARTKLSTCDVMVDFESYLRYGPKVAQIGDYEIVDDIYECLCSDCVENEAQKRLFKRDYDRPIKDLKDLEDLQLMLFPPRVLGYVLRDKHWAQLAVENIEEIEEEDPKKVLEKLHLSGTGRASGAKKKELLLSLVTNHGAAKGELQDLVADKGKGLVFLLYGAPGVGKTSTAQMIARAAKKPLLPISVADVGTSARGVEAKLANIFDLAASWEAILLIDEADVFLQSRSQGARPSAEGSALVSVFLKVLEYYRGIMFLTTNQIAQFDVAVQSRVHIALKYEPLDEIQTFKIFKGFVHQFYEKDVVERDDYDKILKFGEEDLHGKSFDGRQIRNIVSCAMGYAVGQGAKYMQLDHILHVVRYVEEFQKDLAGQMRLWKESQAGTKL